MRRRNETIAAALVACWLLGFGEGSASSSAPGADTARDRPARRIVALAPSLTEILFALDLGDRVVGVGTFARWPPEAASKERLGGLMDPALERIAALRPDLAVLLPGETLLAEQLRGLGVGTLIVPSETIADVEAAIVSIADRCQVPERGRDLLADLRRGLVPNPHPLPGSPRVFLAVARAPGSVARVLAAGPGTFLDELLTRAGAENALAGAPVSYPEIGLEEVLARRPDLIVDLVPDDDLSEPEATALSADWSRAPGLDAMPPACLRVVAGSHVLLPGPRLPQLYTRLREAIAACLEARMARDAPSRGHGRGHE